MQNTTTDTNAAREAGQNEYRYSQLNPGQRNAASAMADADGRPNCIGLVFLIGEDGSLSGFRDTMPHVRHGIHEGKLS